jgi:superfamily II DNA or RNA helicase
MLVRHENELRSILRKYDDFGFEVYDLVNYPERLLNSENFGNTVIGSIDKRRVIQLDSLAITGQKYIETGSVLPTLSKKSLARIQSSFLISEDPQRRLDVRKAATLMHQVSLVQHIFDKPELQRVLIGDEVGLGKTIEAGLIVQRILKQNPNHRILYLAPAKLVQNVATEFIDKLDLNARVWVAGSGTDARLGSDNLVIASINKAVFGENSTKIIESGPWDVLIVDECHHLSDWGKGGGNPNRAYKLVSQLIKNQHSSGRVILLSGTPHQGSETRFVNILRLLSEDPDNYQGASGKVIFRTKDRILDWRGKPLFPTRQVNSPIAVSMGDDYEDWYYSIANLYQADSFGTNASRAAGWAKGLALQWAASSVEAGLAFLVRLGIRRLNWSFEEKVIKDALPLMRPYRGGSEDEVIQYLYERIKKDIGNSQINPTLDDEVNDGIQDEEDDWRPDTNLLRELIFDAIKLLKNKSSSYKWNELLSLIDKNPQEKIVLFAQPIETVMVVAKLLQEKYGERPSIIIGSQKENERKNEVDKFRSTNGPRFLVSSKAGGEGLNLQCSRWLIHLDIPWNPMDLEQRIGRVHRFGSRKTILVDTIVTAGSREVEMYETARRKLAMVAQHMDSEAFENLFTRVMSLVPPKELEGVLSASFVKEEYTTSFDQEIGRLVKEGFDTWNEYDSKYREQSQKIRSLDSGLADWHDIQSYITEYCDAKKVEDVSFTSFDFLDGEIVAVEDSVNAFQVDDEVFSTGDTGGLIPVDKSGKQVKQMGLNSAIIKKQLRKHFDDYEEGGVAFLRKPKELDFLNTKSEFTFIYFFVIQRLRQDGTSWVELNVKNKVYIQHNDHEINEMTPNDLRKLMNALLQSIKVKDTSGLKMINWSKLEEREKEIIQTLRKPEEKDIEFGIRHAVWPIGLIIFV